MDRRLRAFLLLLTCVSFVSLSARAADCLPPQGPDYAGGAADDNKNSVIVFVHGVLSDSVGAWSNGAGTSWPCLLATDPTQAFAQANIFVADYRSAFVGTSPSIEDVATDLRKVLIARKVFAHANVVIVAHSMGGLVVSRMLLQNALSADQLRRIRLVMFYGTPGDGNAVARVCAKLSVNVQCAQMSDDATMRQWVKEWHDRKWDFRRACLAEGADMVSWWGVLPLGWSRIVPEDSASRLCTRLTATLHARDHSDIVKPVARRDDPYKHLHERYTACVAPATVPPPQSVAERSGMQKAVDWFYQLREDLRAARSDFTPVLETALALPTAGARLYLLPRLIGRPSFERGNYELLNGRSFVTQFRTQTSDYVIDAEVAWARQVSVARDQLRDHSFYKLLDELREEARLLEGDTIVALRPRGDSDPTQMMLLLRRGTVADEPEALRMIGLLFVPLPPNGCVE